MYVRMIRNGGEEVEEEQPEEGQGQNGEVAHSSLLTPHSSLLTPALALFLTTPYFSPLLTFDCPLLLHLNKKFLHNFFLYYFIF